MLKREMTTWTSAPWPAQLSLFLIGLTMAIVGISILWGGYHANQRETVIYTVLAARSWVMVMNLDRHGRNWSVT